MFKVEEKSSADGRATGFIFMRPDSIFEGRIYRQTMLRQHYSEVTANVERYIFTGTLAQARMIVHEELGCSTECCPHCNQL